MAKAKAFQKKDFAVPLDLEEAAKFVSLIAENQRAIAKAETRLNEDIEKLRGVAVAEVKTYGEKIQELLYGLFVYSENNREGLTDGDKIKSVKVPSGVFGWRMTPPSVQLANIKKVIAELKKLGLKQFLRYKEPDVNKEAMLENQKLAKTVPGVAITQYEEFFAKPSEVELEVSEKVSKLKKALPG